jgi:hypothetical protein
LLTPIVAEPLAGDILASVVGIVMVVFGTQTRYDPGSRAPAGLLGPCLMVVAALMSEQARRGVPPVNQP